MPSPQIEQASKSTRTESEVRAQRAAKNYYKGGYRALFGGVPIRLAFNPGPHALAIMREGEPSRAGWRESQEQMAVAYARWLATRDSISLISKMEIKPIAVWKIPEGKDWKQRRIASVRFEAGHDCSRYGIRDWRCKKVLATVAIPHWDHEPTVKRDFDYAAQYATRPCFA